MVVLTASVRALSLGGGPRTQRWLFVFDAIGANRSSKRRHLPGVVERIPSIESLWDWNFCRSKTSARVGSRVLVLLVKYRRRSIRVGIVERWGRHEGGRERYGFSEPRRARTERAIVHLCMAHPVRRMIPPEVNSKHSTMHCDIPGCSMTAMTRRLRHCT